MSGKRLTIYDLAAELGMSASYVSKALNDHPVVSQKVKDKVKKKAEELNYRHNLQAANLRQGSSKTIGVVVPFITQNAFSEAIAGVEEACAEKNYSLIICQSNDSYQQECKAIDTLIRQNVDCILVSVTQETHSGQHIEAAGNNQTEIIQFYGYVDKADTHKVVNDNLEATYQAVKYLVNEKYRKIAFLGGPEHISAFRQQKAGYIKGIKEAGLSIPFNYVVDDALSREQTMEAATELLTQKDRPDAFITVSDMQALAVIQLAESLGIEIPQQLAVFGFGNEPFSELITPALSTIDPGSKKIGKQAANLYFEKLSSENASKKEKEKIVIPCQLLIRQSTHRKNIIPLKTAKSQKASR